MAFIANRDPECPSLLDDLRITNSASIRDLCLASFSAGAMPCEFFKMLRCFKVDSTSLVTPTHLVNPQYSSFPILKVMYFIHPTSYLPPPATCVRHVRHVALGNEAGEVTEHILLPKASLKLLDAAEDAAMGKIMGMSGGYHMYIGAIWKGGSPKKPLLMDG